MLPFLPRALWGAAFLSLASGALAQGAVPPVRTPRLVITGAGSTGDVSGMSVTRGGLTSPLSAALSLGGGSTAVSATGGTLTLTPATLASRTIKITGTLTSNLTVSWPAGADYAGQWSLINATSGAFTVTAQVAGQSAGPISVPAGQPRTVTSDGATLTSPVSQATALTTPSTTTTGNLAVWGGINGQSLTDSGYAVGTGGNALCLLDSSTACVFATSPVLGTGPLQRQTADGTATGGNARGNSAIDLQPARTAASQAATGLMAALLGGRDNTASGPYATVTGGVGNVASGQSSVASGQFALASGDYSRAAGLRSDVRGRFGADCWASDLFAANGDAQTCTHVLRGATASASAVRLTANAAAASAANCVPIPDGYAYGLRISVVVHSQTTPANTYSWALPVGTLLRGSGAGSTTLTLGTPAAVATGSFAPSVAVTADTMLGCLNVTVTPPSGNTDTLRAVARVETTEVK